MRRSTRAKARETSGTDAACWKQLVCFLRLVVARLLPWQRLQQGPEQQQAARGDAYLTAAMCRTVIHRLCLSQLRIMACSSFQSFLLIVQLAGIPAFTSIMGDSLQLLLPSDMVM